MEQKSILQDITEHDVVEVQNPFDEVFIVRVARSVVTPHRQNPIQTGNSVADAFVQGLQQSISKGGHSSIAHVQQEIPFQPKQSMKLPGDVAKTAVNQMVREYLQRRARKVKEQKKLKSQVMLMADPTAYMEVERMIVKNSKSMLDSMSVETVEERLQRQLDELNNTQEGTQDGTESEPEFPTETGASKERTPAGNTASRAKA